MKLATLKNTTRDGELLVVNRALTHAISAMNIAPTLQTALDHWAATMPLLKEQYNELNAGRIKDAFPLDFEQLMAPLPRAYQWADASAYVTHVELVRKARGAEMPESFWTDPLMYQGGSDKMLGCRDAIAVANTEWGIDFEAEITVVTDDVPYGVSEENAASHIQLFMLVNDVSLRNLIPSELAKGFGFFHSKPASGFSPVAVTADEFGEAWDGSKLHLPLITQFNGQEFGRPNAGVDMTFGFPKLIAHAAKTRSLSAGTIIGSGTISNSDRSVGSSCIAEKRMLEKIEQGEIKTEFMQWGDRVKIEMLDREGSTIFGAIDQTVTRVG